MVAGVTVAVVVLFIAAALLIILFYSRNCRNREPTVVSKENDYSCIEDFKLPNREAKPNVEALRKDLKSDYITIPA